MRSIHPSQSLSCRDVHAHCAERYLSGLRRGDGLAAKHNTDNSFLALANPPDKFDW